MITFHIFPFPCIKRLKKGGKIEMEDMASDELPPVSVVITTFNRAKLLDACLDSVLRLDYPDFEVVVSEWGSKDETPQVLEKYRGKITVVIAEKKGIAAGRNAGIRAAKHEYIAIIDDDCIVREDWLKSLLVPFLEARGENKMVAVNSQVGLYSGHSLVYLRSAIDEAGLFDDGFIKQRDDSDLAFKLQDLGYKYIFTKPRFEHHPPHPKGPWQTLKFILHRVQVHEYDVLLYKKHPRRSREFLQVKWGFLISPMKGFKIASGMWADQEIPSLSSPKGVTLMSGKNVLQRPIIYLLAGGYVVSLMIVRLYGSIKYRKLLI
jgi:glycosyltransferase involved in cell wall biosynthesis